MAHCAACILVRGLINCFHTTDKYRKTEALDLILASKSQGADGLKSILIFRIQNNEEKHQKL